MRPGTHKEAAEDEFGVKSSGSRRRVVRPCGRHAGCRNLALCQEHGIGEYNSV